MRRRIWLTCRFWRVLALLDGLNRLACLPFVLQFYRILLTYTVSSRRRFWRRPSEHVSHPILAKVLDICLIAVHVIWLCAKQVVNLPGLLLVRTLCVTNVYPRSPRILRKTLCLRMGLVLTEYISRRDGRLCGIRIRLSERFFFLSCLLR